MLGGCADPFEDGFGRNDQPYTDPLNGDVDDDDDPIPPPPPPGS